MTAFAEIPDFLLAPLLGAPAGAWDMAPPGAWSPGEIVSHVAIAIGNCVRGLASRADKPPMRRRPRAPWQFVVWHLVRTTGRFPVRIQAPETARPEQHPDRAATEARLREGVARFLSTRDALLPRRARDLFLKHPVFGDMTIEEWTRFHVVHTAHHRKQLINRLRWTP